MCFFLNKILNNFKNFRKYKIYLIETRTNAKIQKVLYDNKNKSIYYVFYF